MIKKNQPFEFKDEQIKAFENLKTSLTNKPVLKIYSPDKETELHTDASSYGYESVLLQRQEDEKFHPIYYLSLTTTETESRYNSFELEMLAIVRSLERFRVYLLGRPSKPVTDYNSLKLALSKREINSRIFRWSIILEDFYYTLEHRNSTSMQHVDALSRLTMVIDVHDTNENVRLLKIMQSRDPEIQAILNILSQGGEVPDNHFVLRNGILCYKIKDQQVLFVVPRSMRQNVVQAGHDENGHVGVAKTLEIIHRFYWFPKLRTYYTKAHKELRKMFNLQSR